MATIHRTGPTSDAVDSTVRRDGSLVVWAAAFFTIAVLLHNADHARRGADSVGRDVFWLGTAGIALEVGVVVLATQRHRLAALAATAIGFPLALGYVVVHFLPARSLFSDSFTSATNVSRLSWSAASLEVAAALTLGIAGLVVLRRRGGVASAAQVNPDQRSVQQAVTHPIALAMILGNAILLAISFAQL